jgi:uncharacterized protein (DUF58 family)
LLFSRSIVVLALSFTMILIGINSQSGWLFWFAALLLASLAVSWILSLFQVRNLSLVRRHKPEISEDEPLEVTLQVKNGGRLPRHLLEVIDDDPSRESSGRKPHLKPARKSLRDYLNELEQDFPEQGVPEQEVPGQPAINGSRAAFLIPSIASGGEASLTYSRHGLNRGIYQDWPGFFYSEGILGLARHTSRARVASELVVYPHFVELSSFPLVDSFLHPQRTPHDHQSKGIGTDYYGVREYQPGDPLRHVHWKSTARRGQLVVKEFEREVGAPLVVLIDNHAGRCIGNPGSSSLDSAARLAASIVRYAHYAGHPVSLAAYRGDDLFLYDVPHFQAALGWLAALKPEGKMGLGEQVAVLRPELDPGFFLCCIFPALEFDHRLMFSSLPPISHVALVLVDLPSHAGEGAPGQDGDTAGSLVSEFESRPYSSLFSISLYHRGDDLRQCLEKPSIIYNDSLPLGR